MTLTFTLIFLSTIIREAVLRKSLPARLTITTGYFIVVSLALRLSGAQGYVKPVSTIALLVLFSLVYKDAYCYLRDKITARTKRQ